ncbi:MAG: DGQHR domain-containing protein [Candidatus Levybacteria bacterium]|nr:DGQHR domain-containing protein [Candidatus Levybacteria bacterium]
MSEYVSGVLVRNGDLDKVAKSRAKPITEETVDKPLALKYKDQNWIIKKENKKTLKIFKDKTRDELFEDEIWLLFKKMGFEEMNKDRQLRVGIGTSQRQIDVFAKDSKNIFLIECKSAEKPTVKDFSKDIYEILHTKEEIIDSLRKHYGEEYQYIFLLITKNIFLTENNLKLAKENIKKDFFIWTEKETQPYATMAEQYGNHARVIMYTNIFHNRKVLESIKVPAIRGGKGDNKYYCFVIQPEKLLGGIAYIHRREQTNEEITFTYQRMLNKAKLESIKEYVGHGGYFANNIILNFTSRPVFEQNNIVGDIVLGTLTLPREYGSAWIIDGQHRLYGYLNSGKSGDAYIPVLAFDNMPVKDQARLFVDINKEQKPVSADLLWDLYADLYADSTDIKQQELRAISIISKKLNSDKNSPLYQLIELPSQSKDVQKKAHLSLTRVCIAINETKLIREDEDLLFDERYDKTTETAYEVIKEYFNTISKSYLEDWEKGEKGLLCSGVGIRMLINILRQLLKYLNFYENKSIYFSKNKERFNEKTIEILKSVIEKIKNMTSEERSKIRGETSREKIVENTQKLLWDLKEKTNFGRELWNKGGWNPGIPDDETDKRIKDLLDETEIKMRSFIVKELKLLYGNEWWEKGIPSEMKDRMKEIKEKDASKIPWKGIELTPNEEELRLAGTSYLKDMIIKRSNWVKFESSFVKDKEIVSTAFTFFEALRNKFAHPERVKDLDNIEKGLGYWNMKWLRRCIGLDKPSTLLDKISDN